MTITVTHKARTSLNYRFTTTDRNDPQIAALRQMLKEVYIPYNSKIKSYGVRIRPRGPRENRYSKDTPIANATHFDIYVKENYDYS